MLDAVRVDVLVGVSANLCMWAARPASRGSGLHIDERSTVPRFGLWRTLVFVWGGLVECRVAQRVSAVE